MGEIWARYGRDIGDVEEAVLLRHLGRVRGTGGGRVGVRLGFGVRVRVRVRVRGRVSSGSGTSMHSGSSRARRGDIGRYREI